MIAFTRKSMEHRKIWLLLAAGVVVAGCTAPPAHLDYFAKSAEAREAESFLAGEALEQRKLSMRRAHRDMKSFFATIESLRRHRKRDEIRLFENFLRPYMATHLERLLSSRDTSWNPELSLLDANLLFAQAAILIELEDRADLVKVIGEIGRRFEGMESMIVEYPVGSENTLADAVLELQRMRYRL